MERSGEVVSQLFSQVYLCMSSAATSSADVGWHDPMVNARSGVRISRATDANHASETASQPPRKSQ